MSLQVNISTADLRWLAGLLEGEGWFGLQKKKNNRVYPVIQLKMCDGDVVQRVADLWGKNVGEAEPRHPNHSKTYRVLVFGEAAAEWALCLLPYMGKRRRERIKEVVCQWWTQQVKEKE